MLKHDIGVNAGIIWNLLKDKSALSTREISELTGFRENVLILSLGWLARENKINFFEKNNMIYLESSYHEVYY